MPLGAGVYPAHPLATVFFVFAVQLHSSLASFVCAPETASPRHSKAFLDMQMYFYFGSPVYFDSKFESAFVRGN